MLLVPALLLSQSASRKSKELIYDSLNWEAQRTLYKDVDSSEYFGRMLLDQSRANHDSSWMALAYEDIGYCYYYRNRLRKAIIYFKLSEKIYLKNNNLAELSNIYMDFGNAYGDLGLYSKGIDYYKKSEQSFLKSGSRDTLQLAYVYYNMAESFLDLDDVYHTEEYLSKASAYVFKDSIKDLFSAVHNIQTKLAIKKQDLIPAHKLARQALSESRETQDRLEEVGALENLAIIQRELNNNEAYLQYLDSAYQIALQYNDPRTIAEEESLLAEAYLADNQKEKALQYAEESFKKGLQQHSLLLSKKISAIYAKSLEANNNYKEALKIYKLYGGFVDSLSMVDISERLYRSENRIKEKNNSLLKAKAQLQSQSIARNKLIILVISIILLFCLVFMVLMIKNIRNKQRHAVLLHNKQKLIDQKSQELQKKNEELKELNRGKDKLFSILTHDIRQPFNQISSLLQILEVYQLNDPDLQKLVGQIKESTESTRSAVNNLLTWSKSQFAKIKRDPGSIEVEGLMGKLQQELEPSLKSKSLSLIKNIDRHSCVLADPNHLEIILRNLLMNAIKFSNEKGRILVEVTRKNDKVEITITDEGIGMTEDQLNKLFDTSSHFSTPGTLNEKGTGIGMIIVSDFVKENEGELKIESAENKGSTFKIILPAA